MRRLLATVACIVGLSSIAHATEDGYDPQTEYIVYVLMRFGYPDSDVHYKLSPPAGYEVSKSGLDAWIRDRKETDTVYVVCAMRPELRAHFNVDKREDRRAGNCTDRLPYTIAAAP